MQSTTQPYTSQIATCLVILRADNVYNRAKKKNCLSLDSR